MSAALWVLAAAAARAGVPPCSICADRLRANYLFQPYVDSERVMLSWEVAATDPAFKGLAQTKFRVTAVDAASGEVVWNSTLAASDSVGVEYLGARAAGMRVVWSVDLWDQDGVGPCACHSGAADSSSWFEFALLAEADWRNASWVTRNDTVYPSQYKNECSFYTANPTAVVRRAWTVDETRTLASARVYVAGLGYFRASLNGVPLTSAGEARSICEPGGRCVPSATAREPPPSYLDPPFSDFGTRVYYSAYNVTAALQRSRGSAVLEVELGNGWYAPFPLRFWGNLNMRQTMAAAVGDPKCRVLVVMAYTDGSEEAVVSEALSGTWTASNTSTVLNNLYLGEVFDNTNGVGGDPAPVAEAAPFSTPGVALQVSPIPPVTPQGPPLPARRLAVHPGAAPTCAPVGPSVLADPVPPNEVVDRVEVLDTGRNHAGTCRFDIAWNPEAPAGATARVVAKYGEALYPNGCVNVMTSVAGQIKTPNKGAPCQPPLAFQGSELRLKKGAAAGAAEAVTWEPSFSWHGMRYVELHVLSGGGVPTLTLLPNVSLTCTALRTNVGEALVDWASTDARLNTVLSMSKNTFDSNLMSVQSDCPHRERFGYGGDALASGEALLSRYDFAAFYAKRAVDFVDAQRSNGGYTEVAPFNGIASSGLGDGSGPIGWEAYLPEALLWLRKYYGHRSLLKELYPSVLRYAALLDANPPGIRAGLGDWMPLEPTDVAFTGLNFARSSYLAVANISNLVGNASAAALYTNRAAAVRDAINAEFLNASTGAYGAGSQTGQSMALYNHIAPNATREQVLSVLVDNIRGAGNVSGGGDGPPRGGAGPHMLAGMFGTKWVLGTLSEHGLSDLALEILTQESWPSVYWMSSNPYANATTVWESWFFSNNTFSHNHPMFASHEQWVLNHVLGIMPAPDADAFSKVLIKPSPPLLMAQRAPSQTAAVSATYRTARGPIMMAWDLAAATRQLNVRFRIPPNVAAVVALPNVPVHTVGSGYHTYMTTL